MKKPLQFNLRTLFLVTALVAVWAGIASIAGKNGYEPEFANLNLGLLSTGWFVVSYQKLMKRHPAASKPSNFMMFIYALGLFLGAPLAIIFNVSFLAHLFLL